jgi:hypothetical protein
MLGRKLITGCRAEEQSEFRHTPNERSAKQAEKPVLEGRPLAYIVDDSNFATIVFYL